MVSSVTQPSRTGRYYLINRSYPNNHRQLICPPLLFLSLKSLFYSFYPASRVQDHSALIEHPYQRITWPSHSCSSIPRQSLYKYRTLNVDLWCAIRSHCYMRKLRSYTVSWRAPPQKCNYTSGQQWLWRYQSQDLWLVSFGCLFFW